MCLRIIFRVVGVSLWVLCFLVRDGGQSGQAHGPNLLIGASIGGIVFPIMLNKLVFGPQGFALGVRASAGVVTGLMAIANALMRTRPEVLKASASERSDARRISFTELLRDLPYMTCVAACVINIVFRFFDIHNISYAAVSSLLWGCSILVSASPASSVLTFQR